MSLAVFITTLKLKFILRHTEVDVNFQRRDWLKGGNDNKVK